MSALHVTSFEPSSQEQQGGDWTERRGLDSAQNPSVCSLGRLHNDEDCRDRRSLSTTDVSKLTVPLKLIRPLSESISNTHIVIKKTNWIESKDDSPEVNPGQQKSFAIII